MALGESYEEFIEKFKPKKTTDDCYTPPAIYEAVKDWAVKEYGIDPAKIVRPFYPGGDYERFEYPKGCVVLDNPPFSILSKILRFYDERGIAYFLFAPTLTIFSAAKNTRGGVSLLTQSSSMRMGGRGSAQALSRRLTAHWRGVHQRFIAHWWRQTKREGKNRPQNRAELSTHIRGMCYVPGI